MTFSSGNSYTNVAFDPNGAQPSPFDPMGNRDLSNIDENLTRGPNWAVDLTTVFNSTQILTYDLAFNCATVDKAIVDNSGPCPAADGHQIVDQVGLFKQILAQGSKFGNFTEQDSLFLIWVGINDAHLSYARQDIDSLMIKVVDKYFDEVEVLYQLGARNFLFMMIPREDLCFSCFHEYFANTRGAAYERTPQVMDDVNSATRISKEKHAYEVLNVGLTIKWQHFLTTHRARTVLVDTAPIFNEALDDPSKIGRKNSTCWGGPPEDGCVWADDFHPGPELHRWIAGHVAKETEPVFSDFFGRRA
jgi:phospholipase/lecithinase/hemolysin